MLQNKRTDYHLERESNVIFSLGDGLWIVKEQLVWNYDNSARVRATQAKPMSGLHPLLAPPSPIWVENSPIS